MSGFITHSALVGQPPPPPPPSGLVTAEKGRVGAASLRNQTSRWSEWFNLIGGLPYAADPHADPLLKMSAR